MANEIEFLGNWHVKDRS